jgi:hypothetical protein
MLTEGLRQIETVGRTNAISDFVSPRIKLLATAIAQPGTRLIEIELDRPSICLIIGILGLPRHKLVRLA